MNRAKDNKGIRAAILTSNSLRHQYFVQSICRYFNVRVVLQEPKKNYYVELKEESQLARNHFTKLTEAEENEFSERIIFDNLPEVSTVEDINSEELINDILNDGVTTIFLFGTAILKKSWLNAFPQRIINLHLGLSPYYRGTASLFWPFVHGELECVGTTIHLAVEKVDAGAILERVKIEPHIGDTYYSYTNRLIRHSIERFPEIAQAYIQGEIIPVQQNNYPEARIYRKADFNDQALLKALKYVGDGLTLSQINAAKMSSKCNCSL
ncbi:MAG: formyltransferase family protein [Desulfomonilia bacterium]